MASLSGPTRVYIGGTALIGGALLVFAATRPLDWWLVVPLALLVVVADAAPASMFKHGTGSVTLSVTFPIRMAAVVLTGPWGAIIATTATLFVYVPGGRPLVKRVFNVAQYNIAVGAAGLVYVGLGGHVGPLTVDTFVASMLPFAASALVYYAFNTALVSMVVALTSSIRPHDLWRQAIVPLAPTYLGYGPIGLLLAVLWGEVGVFAAVLALGPIAVARWASIQLVAERGVQESALRTFARAVETKDFYTRGHSERVSQLSTLMGREAGFSDERVALLGYAGLLHDIGKIRVPTQILQKAGPLTRDEYAAIQLHPVYGQAMMRDVSFLDDVLPGILHHHERFDGAGYPMGLAAYDIPEFARVITVADAFDCMTSTRSYRPARSTEEALAELNRGSGTQFDPVMVELLGRVVARDGWTPNTTPVAVPLPELAVAFDHDDPRRPIPVENAASDDGDTGERGR
ncbi:MAG: HD domain-containing protein [Streptosporangiales bacterium]|nr:HD domain-containing protein [Streptosporangiales bacterium]